MKNITTVLEYHDRTKHRPARYAASLGYMDWATQPDPFRRYENAPLIPLTHSELTPPYHLLFQKEALPTAPLCLESLSQLLRYSLGLAAIKSHGGSSWALRCNASSGNLQPTECYIIAPAIAGISDHATLSHYAPREHALELLHTYHTPLMERDFIFYSIQSYGVKRGNTESVHGDIVSSMLVMPMGQSKSPQRCLDGNVLLSAPIPWK